MAASLACFPRRRLLLAPVAALGLSVGTCRSATAPQLPGVPTDPAQLPIVGAPEILRWTAPLARPGESRPDSAIAVRITAPDSSFALDWRPTELLLETSAGFHRTILLHPPACLVPNPASGMGFPFNFTWWVCDGVGINTSVVLTPERLREISAIAGGDTTWTVSFKTSPGGYYEFRVGVGKAVTEAAVRRLSALPEVTEASRILNDPLCVISDIVPHPPCDPWRLVARHPYVLDRTAGGDTIPLQRGGWVRATYALPDGSTRVTQVSVPEAGIE